MQMAKSPFGQSLLVQLWVWMANSSVRTNLCCSLCLGMCHHPPGCLHTSIGSSLPQIFPSILVYITMSLIMYVYSDYQSNMAVPILKQPLNPRLNTKVMSFDHKTNPYNNSKSMAVIPYISVYHIIQCN